MIRPPSPRPRPRNTTTTTTTTTGLAVVVVVAVSSSMHDGQRSGCAAGGVWSGGPCPCLMLHGTIGGVHRGVGNSPHADSTMLERLFQVQESQRLGKVDLK